MVALALPLLITACDRRTVEDDAAATPAEDTASREAGTPAPVTDVEVPASATAPADATAPTAGAISQADALAMLMAVNEHEIAAADQALAHNVSGGVRDYAQMMKTEHTQNLTESSKLGGAVSTAIAVKDLRDKGEAELRTLDALSGDAYAKAYIDAMVKGHTEALALLDGTLLAAATDANVRQHFTATRAAVAHHLERAKEVQASLK